MRWSWRRAIVAVTAAAACEPEHPTRLKKDTAEWSTACYPQAHIEMERGPCFGTCPHYRLTVEGDGSIRFVGIRYVSAVGTQTRQISPNALRRLLSSIEDAGFFELADAYPTDDGCPAMYTDHPSTTLTVELCGRRKRVRDNHGCQGVPALVRLRRLERMVDELAGVGEWARFDPEIEGRRTFVEELLGPCEATECERSAGGFASSAWVLARFGQSRVVVCRDGTVLRTDERLRFVADLGLQSRLSAVDLAELARLAGEAADSRPGDLPATSAELPWIDGATHFELAVPNERTLRYFSSIDTATSLMAPLLDRLHGLATGEDAFAAGAREVVIRVVADAPPRYSIFPRDVVGWPASDLVPLRRLSGARLSPGVWRVLAQRLAVPPGTWQRTAVRLDGRPWGIRGPATLFVLAGIPSPRDLCGLADLPSWVEPRP